MGFLEYIETTYYVGVSLRDYIIIVLCVLIALIADRVFQYVIKRALKRVSEREDVYRQADRRVPKSVMASKFIVLSLGKPLHWFMVTVGVLLGLTIMDTPDWGTDILPEITKVLKSLSLWYFIWFLLRVLGYVKEVMMEHAKATEDKIDDTLVPLICGIVKWALIAVGVLGVLQNIGVKIETILAWLSIVGAAIALAAKDTIANIFGALVVFFDKPFAVGDWVTVNGVEGEIEEIRLRVTVIRTFDNTQVLIPNAVLSSSNINNWQRRRCRKLDCSFGVLYSTTSEQLAQIVEDIRTHIKNTPSVFGKEPKFYVNLNGFGDSSFDINVITYTFAKSYVQQLQDKQDFMLAIIKIVEKNGTGFAFPTRTLDVPANMPIHVKMD